MKCMKPTEIKKKQTKQNQLQFEMDEPTREIFINIVCTCASGYVAKDLARSERWRWCWRNNNKVKAHGEAYGWTHVIINRGEPTAINCSVWICFASDQCATEYGLLRVFLEFSVAFNRKSNRNHSMQHGNRSTKIQINNKVMKLNSFRSIHLFETEAYLSKYLCSIWVRDMIDSVVVHF